MLLFFVLLKLCGVLKHVDLNYAGFVVSISSPFVQQEAGRGAGGGRYDI